MWCIPVVIVVSLVLHYSGASRPLENSVERILQPLQIPVYEFSQHLLNPRSATDEQLSYTDLQTRTQQDEETIQRLVIENARLKTALEETDLLEEQTAFLQERSFQAITARVTSRSTEQISQTILINRGAAQGIRVGFPVIIQDGLLIGTISQVQDYAAEVLLLTSFDSRISGVVQNDSQSPGIVKGAHNLTLEMDFIPQFDPLSVGQSVYTSGTDPSIPSGLVIGQITQVQNDSGTLFQQASLQSVFQTADISIVSVIVP